MKDKRNCNNNNANYPMYPPFQGGQGFGSPMMVPPMGYPSQQPFPSFQTYPNYNSGISNNTFDQQINNLEQQVNTLDQRVTRLEKQYMNNNNNNYNKYNDSNYYMV